MDCDERLVRQSLSGDEEAFRQLVDTYKAYVFAVILCYTKDRFEAENLAQDVFLQVYRALPQYQYGSFKAWIGKIAVSKAVDWLRSQRRLTPERISENAGVVCENPESVLLKKEHLLKIRTTFNCLPDIYRRAAEKFYFEERSYQEIAREEGVSVKTVESRLYRARILFRKKWEEGKNEEAL